MMRTLNAKVLDPTHLELAEPLPTDAGEWVRVLVPTPENEDAGWRRAAEERFLAAYDDQDAIYDEL
jgi:hypothetical protein